MPTLAKGKLIKFGESGLVLTVPKAWYYGLKPGDKVEIVADGELVVRPEATKGQTNGKADR